jgi:inorganic pyrophosphatase
MQSKLFEKLNIIVKSSKVIIDRPKGTPHPRYPEFIYPLDYGYLEGTQSQDGSGIDVWLGSGDQTEISGFLVIADAFKRDSEIKILLGCNEKEAEIAVSKSNKGDMAAIFIRKDSNEV